MFGLLFRRKFLPFFAIQFFSALNDNILKSAVVTIITFSEVNSSIIPKEQLTTFASLLFILPFFLFSSYAGKLADSYSKRTIVQIIKWAELLIMSISAAAIYFNSCSLLLCMVLALGIHAAFFGPIKYSWLPQMINTSKELFVANGYVELTTFIAILYGQMLGVFLSAGYYNLYLVTCLLCTSLIGLILSYMLPDSEVSGAPVKISKNFIKDSYLMYKNVTEDIHIKLNLHSISWFWLLGLVYLTYLPIFTLKYINADANTYGVIVSIFSLSIGIGSLIVSKLSKGIIRYKYIVLSGVGISVVTFVLLLLYPHEKTSSTPMVLSQIILSYRFMLSLLCIACIGLLSGSYSVTCYNSLQLISPNSIRSQIISSNNILNSLYMIVGSVASSLCLLCFTLWQFLFILMWCNIFYIMLLNRMNKHASK